MERPREVSVVGTAIADHFYYENGAPAGSLGQLRRIVDPDGVVTLYTYNSLGERELEAIDMNANGTIDLAGPDRVSKTIHSYGTHAVAGAAVVVEQSSTQTYLSDNSSTATEASREEVSVDGRKRWSTRFGLTSSSATAHHPAG